MAHFRLRHEDQLYRRVAEILDAAQTHTARTINTALVQAYWLIGSEIIRVEQRGRLRAAYEEQVLVRLAARLSKQFGRGYDLSTLKRIRKLAASFPSGLIRAPRRSGKRCLRARSLYEIEAAREVWSTRELERQIGATLFERLLKSRGKRHAKTLSKKGQQVADFRDVLKGPCVIEFLELNENPKALPEVA